MRPEWSYYFLKTTAIIFVVDSTEIKRLDDAAKYLTYLFDFLGMCEVSDIPILVFANKQDLGGAMSTGEISEALKLGELRGRKWNTIACSAIDGTGIADGMDWLVVSDSCLPRHVPWRASRRLTLICVANSSIQKGVRSNM